MLPKRLIFPFLLVLGILFSACSSPTPAATPTPSITPTPEITPQHIADLVERGTITFELTSGAINELGLHVVSRSDEPLKIDIPAGTYFVNEDAGSQNMVIRHPAGISLQPFGQADIQLEAACANLHLVEPTGEDVFTIQRTPRPYELTKIMDMLTSAEVDYPVEQAAIWIVTDDATFDELGLLVEGSRFGTSIIGEETALRAMMLVDQAGLNIREHAIWGDRSQFIGTETDPQVASWLNDQVATQAVEQATQAVQTATAQALITPTPEPVEIDQYATTATASSQFSSTDWSAMQAVGAPDTSTCGNLPSAWKTLNTTGVDWLLLTYEQAVIPNRIVIHQTYHPGAIILVEVIDESDIATVVYEAAPAILSQCPDDLEIDVTGVQTLVRSIRVTVDQTGHQGRNLIDAVQLVGMSR